MASRPLRGLLLMGTSGHLWPPCPPLPLAPPPPPTTRIVCGTQLCVQGGGEGGGGSARFNVRNCVCVMWHTYTHIIYSNKLGCSVAAVCTELYSTGFRQPSHTRLILIEKSCSLSVCSALLAEISTLFPKLSFAQSGYT